MRVCVLYEYMYIKQQTAQANDFKTQDQEGKKGRTREQSRDLDGRERMDGGECVHLRRRNKTRDGFVQLMSMREPREPET